VAHLRAWRTKWTVDAAHARRSFQERTKNFFHYCHTNGWIATNPTLQLSSIPVAVAENIRAFEGDEYEKVLAAIDKTVMTDANKARIRALMQLQRWSGLSLVDAVTLSKDELQKQNGVYRVVCERQKTGQPINNVIPVWLAEELLKVKNGNPKFFFWTGNTTPEDAPSYFHKLYRRVFKVAGVNASSHDFRHTYAIDLLTKGVDIRAVSKALGHSSVTITEKYYSRWCKSQQANLDKALLSALE
jgi:integrase/recombinase XerD